MAGMDLSARREGRGISVFWMILAMGVGVFALLAILLVSAEQAVEPVPYDDSAEIIVDDGETTVNGVGNSAAASDSNEATSFDEGSEVAVDGPTEEGDLSSSDVSVDVEPGPAADGEADEAGAQEATSQEDLVVDPDGTTAPVDPTPSGPEGRDDETIADELELTE